MSIEVKYNKEKTVKTIYDSLNPRIYHTEYACKGCGIWLDEQEVIFAKENGKLSVTEGNPYCDRCLPEEKEENTNA